MATPKFLWPDKKVWDRRQFRSIDKPAQPNTINSGWSNKPATSMQDAFEKGSYRFKDENGVMQVIVIVPVRGIKNTYQFKVVPASSLAKAYGSKDPNKNRSAASKTSTAPDVDEDLAKLKIEATNAKTQQYHHMMDLQYYAPYFDGLSSVEKAAFYEFLNKRGFFPGDDRRNYVGLIGSNHGSGSEHQGGIHPATSKVRRINPQDVDAISAMNLDQRMAHILPSIYADRAELQKLIRDKRGRALQSSPFPLSPEVLAEDQRLLAESTNPIARSSKFQGAVKRVGGSLRFVRDGVIPGPMDVVQSALGSNVGKELGEGDIGGSLIETGKNFVSDLKQQFTTPEGLATTAGTSAATAAATALAPQAAAVGGLVLVGGSIVYGLTELETGIEAGQRGVSVDQIRKEREEQWNVGLKNASNFKSRVKKHLKKALQINGQLPIPF